jgi:hypothetical protein
LGTELWNKRAGSVVTGLGWEMTSVEMTIILFMVGVADTHPYIFQNPKTMIAQVGTTLVIQ